EKAHPDAKLDLDYKNPLELLIALILAAQARDDLVNQITANLFKIQRSAADYANTPLTSLERQIGKINFYRTKARSIHNCCHHLVDRFDGKVPANLDDLLSLPGVGRKTANILLGNAYGRQTIGVDTHVLRLSQRLGFTKNTDPDKIEADLMVIVPDKQRVRFCHLLQYHGRRLCWAKKPNCPACTIRELCPFPHKTKSVVGAIRHSPRHPSKSKQQTG
ncbi:MAG TPA: endonuclease III, partial [Candidatus Binatia bacterium]|nr:endonuclease III [Candidatus Binatia bacterium]